MDHIPDEQTKRHIPCLCADPLTKHLAHHTKNSLRLTAPFSL
jgi:hypothetical protein